MTLNASNGNLVIGGDSTGAVGALKKVDAAAKETGTAATGIADGLTGILAKYGGMAAGVGAVGAAIALLKSSYDEFNKAHKESADLFSQFGQTGFAGAQMAVAVQDATDGMMKIQTAAMSFNLIVKGAVGGTVEQVQSLGKASVDIAQQIGGNVDQIMQELTQAVMTGRTRTIAQYGIMIDEANVDINAHINALEKYGETATANDIKIEKSRTLLEAINAQYKDQLVTVGDINEIEEKYQNERARNGALSAKVNEKMAKQIQELKHSWQDLKDSATSYFNGLEYNSAKVMALVSNEAKHQLTIMQLDYEGAMEKIYNVAYAGDSARQYEDFALKIRDQTRLIAGTMEFYRLKEIDALKKVETENNKKLASLKKEIDMGRLLAAVQRQLGATEKAERIESLIVEQEKLNRAIENEQSMIADTKVYKVAEAGLTDVQKVLRETGENMAKNAKDLKGYSAMNIDDLEKSGKGHQADLVIIQKKVQQYDDIQKYGKALTPVQQANYNLLKKQESTLKNQVDLVAQVLAKILGIKLGLKPDPVDAKGAAPAWVKEYENIAKLIDKGDADIQEALLSRFGTNSKSDIKAILKRDNNEIYKLEKKLKDDLFVLKETAGKAEAEQIKLRDEGVQLEIDRNKKEATDQISAQLEMIRGLSTIKVDYDAKIAELDNKKKKTREETLTEEKAALQKQIDAVKAAQSALAGVRREMYGSDVIGIEQYKAAKTQEEELRKREYEARKSHKEKVLELEREKTRELREEMKKVQADVEKYGEQLIKSGAGAMFDAMTISNAALKESAMTRGEMIQKALQDTLQGIAKEAAVQSIFQGAMALASLAIGDMRGATAHGASAAAYAAVAGTAYLGSRAISAPSDSEIARRKEAQKGTDSAISNSRAGVAGAKAAAAVVNNYYFPSGMILGTADDVVRQFNRAQDEAERRGVA